MVNASLAVICRVQSSLPEAASNATNASVVAATGSE
jgi:hypothetical protein